MATANVIGLRRLAATCGAALLALAPGCGGDDSERAKDAYRAVIAAAAEYALAAESEPDMERARFQSCRAYADFAHADYALRQRPTEAESLFLNGDLYQKTIYPVGIDGVKWCLRNDYIALDDLPADRNQDARGERY